MRILLVEDSGETRFLVQHALASKHTVFEAANIQAARDCLVRETFDLILLDINLPDGNGVDFCAELTNQSGFSTPIVMLTAKSQISEKVLGLSSGADDYIVKPFDAAELLARVDARLRPKNPNQETLRLHGLEFSLDHQKAFLIEPDGKKELDLTPTEFRILLLFAKNPTKVFSRDEIVKHCWQDGLHIQRRGIDAHISHLRRKIASETMNIVGVYGKGYTMEITTSNQYFVPKS